MVLLIGLPIGAFASDSNLTIGAEKILGEYKGNLEVYVIKRMVKYDYSVSIFKFDAEKNEVSLKAQCNDCESKTSTLSGCKITEKAPVFSFSCKGEGWHVDYQLEGEHLKANGVSKKGNPYTVSVTKVQKLEK
jgi:hypothetical protein